MKKFASICFFSCLIVFNLNAQSDTTKKWGIDVKKITEYDFAFIRYWEYLDPLSVIISKDSIVVNNNKEYPVMIPTGLPLNQDVIYETKRDKINYTLKVKRVNYTNVEFEIIGKRKKKIVLERKGTAVLVPSFHLGAAGVYEKSEEEVYRMDKYMISSKEYTEQSLLIPDGTIEVIDYTEVIDSKELILNFVIIQ